VGQNIIIHIFSRLRVTKLTSMPKFFTIYYNWKIWYFIFLFSRLWKYVFEMGKKRILKMDTRYPWVGVFLIPAC